LGYSTNNPDGNAPHEWASTVDTRVEKPGLLLTDLQAEKTLHLTKIL